MCSTNTKNDKNHTKINDIKTLFTKQPSKAKVQELKWKSTINRQSLPLELPELCAQNIIMEVKNSNRRKTESDIDLNIDSYNINPLEKEEIEYSRKKKHKKKCSKTQCSLFSEKEKTVVFSDDLPTSSKKSKKTLNDAKRSNNVEDKKTPRVTKIKLLKNKNHKNLLNKSISTSDSSYIKETYCDDSETTPRITKIKLIKPKKRDKILNELNICENSTEIIHIEETSPEKMKPNVIKNAFLVMMEARNNVIGSNSDGEEKSEEKDSKLEENLTHKSKIKQRKNLLENWANEKGAKKRKLKEEAREEYVLKTLNRRAKRFKAMLENSVDKGSETSTPIQISSSSEKSLNRRAKRSTEKLKISKNNQELLSNSNVNSVKKNVSCSTTKSVVLNETLTPKLNSTKTVDLDESLDVFSCRTLRTRKNKIDYTENLADNNDSSNAIIINNEDNNDILQSVQKRIEKAKQTKKKSHQLAPLFIKKSVLKQDKQTIEAKKNFLQSGLPEQCIKIIEKQKIQENYEYTLFPRISHVLQSEKIEYLSNSNLDCWSSMRKRTNYIWNPTSTLETFLNLGLFTNCLCSTSIKKPNLYLPTKYSNTKQIIKEFKKFNPKFPANVIHRNFKTRFDSESDNEFSNLMWTEKYKPVASQEIIGNTKSITELKEWLSTWLVNREKKNNHYELDTDFVDSDVDSRDSMSSRVNTIVLVGPNGSGKTTSVYAIANDLNINVLEINASSQRNGKRILNDIHEATQSRHFRENLNNCVQLKRCENGTKYTLILIEDIDIVFSVLDDGFLGAINNIIMSGKRPVIITSSDSYSAATQKYMSQNKTLKFHPVSSSLTIPWLQIISIMEGIWPNEKDVTELFSLNNRDLRKTLLDLQFLILSGKEENNETKISNLSLKYFMDSMFLNLYDLYWILPYAWEQRLKIESLEENTPKEEQKNIDNISILFDNLALLDVAYTKDKLECGLNPATCIWKSEYSQLSNSLSTNTSMDMYTNSVKTMYGWTHSLISKSMELVKLSNNEDLSWKTSSMDKIRLKRQMQMANSKFLDGISLSSHLGPRNLGIDYFPYLRAINRTESQRVLINNKRGNRFCNYLKSLNIHCTDTQTELILNSLSS